MPDDAAHDAGRYLPETSGESCPACEYPLGGLESPGGSARLVCPECGLRPGVAATRIQERRRRSPVMFAVMVCFAGRACFYALATSKAAREMSQYVGQSAWQWFKGEELGTTAGVLEFVWRISSVVLSACLFIAYAVTMQLDDRGVRRRRWLWEAALGMVGLEALFQVLWWAGV